MATTIIEEKSELIEKAAATIARILASAIQKRGRAVLGISGSKENEEILRGLAKQNIEWSQIHIMMTDEACTTLNSLDSGWRRVQEALTKPLLESHKIAQDNLHPFVYNEAHAIKAVINYQAKLNALGGFDIIVASTTDDGHIAALFPKHASVQKENIGFFLMTNAPAPPAKRMTASRKLLLKARAGILVIRSKKAWDAYNDPAKTLIDCPAKLINDLPEAYVFHVHEPI